MKLDRRLAERHPILIADSFGRRLAGSWQMTGGGKVAPVITQPRVRRIACRTVNRELTTGAMAKPLERFGRW